MLVSGVIEWAQRLKVSRTPVREAMRKMQQEGVLRGYKVKWDTLHDLVVHGVLAGEWARRRDERAGGAANRT